MIVKIPACPMIPTIKYVTSKAAHIRGIILKNINVVLKNVSFSFSNKLFLVDI